MPKFYAALLQFVTAAVYMWLCFGFDKTLGYQSLSLLYALQSLLPLVD